MNVILSFWNDTRTLWIVRGFPAFLVFRMLYSASGWVSATLTFPILIYQFHATPAQMGVASVLLGLPFIVLGPRMGAWADRTSPPLFMALGALYRVAGMLMLAWAPTLEVFIAVMLFNAIGGTASAAEPVVQRRLLTDDQILAASSLGRFLDQLTKLVAPLIGAVLLFMGTRQQGYLFVAAMSLAMAGCAVWLGRSMGWAHADRQHRGGPQKKKAGLRALPGILRTHPKIKTVVLMTVGTTITMGMHAEVLIYLLHEQRLPEGAYGVHTSCTALGAIVCSVVLKKMMAGRDQARVMLGLAVGFIATILGTGLWALSGVALHIVPLSIVWTVSGFFFVGKIICYVTLMQTESPKENVGLVMASSQSLMLLLLQITPLIGLAITHYWSAALAYVVAAGLGLLMLIPRTARRFDNTA